MGLLFLAIFILILVILAGMGLFLYRQFLRLPLEPLASARPPLDCSLPAGSLPDDTFPDLTLTGNETESDIRRRSIELPAGVTLLPPANLTLVAFGDLTINGRITPVQGDSITLVSLNGTVTIGSTGGITPFPATLGVPVNAVSGVYAQALGTPGATAGFVKIVAPSVVIEGVVRAQPGGSAGGASALPTMLGGSGGKATAGGGKGGTGGTSRLCVQLRLVCSVGVSPARVKVRSSVAWMAGWRETETLKPIDKAIFRVVSESPGRNANERRGGPESAKPRRPSLQPEGEGSMGYRRLTEAVVHSGGVVAAAR